MPERFHLDAHMRRACLPMASFALALVLTVFAALLAPGSLLAAPGADTPWIVTRKADNRVLPKQDNVEDIESGRAMPDMNAKQAAESSPAAKASAPIGKASAPDAKTPAKTAKTPAEAASKTPVVPSSGMADAPTITVTPAAVEVMLPTSVAVTDTRYLNLDNPRRLAMDVMGAWKYSGPKIFKVGKGPLEKVEIGRHPDFLRLVLHLTKGPVPSEIVPRFQLVEGGLKMSAPLAR